jgi:hypothetical protein
MKLNQQFKNVFTYAAGIQKWCSDQYELVGKKLDNSFCEAFAICDWNGTKNQKFDKIIDTCNRLLNEYRNDYKTFTEIVVSVNLLAFANDQLINQGIEDREEIMNFYSDLFYKLKDEFYKQYENNEEACDYFFEMTD